MDRMLVQPEMTPFQHRNAQPRHLRDPPLQARPRSLTPHPRCPCYGGTSVLRCLWVGGLFGMCGPAGWLDSASVREAPSPSCPPARPVRAVSSAQRIRTAASGWQEKPARSLAVWIPMVRRIVFGRRASALAVRGAALSITVAAPREPGRLRAGAPETLPAGRSAGLPRGRLGNQRVDGQNT
jgi:hypothetical protein